MELQKPKIVTIRKGNNVRIAKTETLLDKDLITLKYKASINNEQIKTFNTIEEMDQFMKDEFYFVKDLEN